MGMEGIMFSGCEVFSATRRLERLTLGGRVTQWISKHPGFEIVGTDVMQSSDSEFHCLSFVVWYRASTQTPSAPGVTR